MSIRTEIQRLAPSSVIELFELDMSVTTSGGKLFFHAGTNNLDTSVVWQGVEYLPWPIKASGFDKTGSGSLPRPKMTVSNYGGTISAEVAANDDLVGCTITRRRTLARFLDASNFPSGNATADASQHFPDEIWFVEQKTLETKDSVEFELSSVFDLMGVQLPARQIIKTAARGNTAERSVATQARTSTRTTIRSHRSATTTAPSVSMRVRRGETSSPAGSSLLAAFRGNTCSVILNPLPAPR